MDTAGWTISVIAIAIVAVIALRWSRDRADGGGAVVDRPSRPGGSPARATSSLLAATPTRFEFLSPPWMVMARQEITAALAGHDLDGEPFVLAEEFTDAPSHLAPVSRAVGFSVRVGEGTVWVEDGAHPDADLRVVMDYAEARALAADPDAAATDPEEAARRMAEGTLRIDGDPSRLPPVLRQVDLHRILAAHTAPA